MFLVGRRRADIDRLLTHAVTEARLKDRRIDRIDPLVKCARRLFPYLHDDVIYELSRIALRILMSEQNLHTSSDEYQTKLTSHISA